MRSGQYLERKLSSRFIIIILFTLILIGLSASRPTVNAKLRYWSMTAGAPIQYLVDFPSRFFGWLEALVSSKQELVQENMELRSKNLLYQANLNQLITQQNENRSLRELQEASNEQFSKIEAAKLLSVASNPYRKLIVLNKGLKNGIFINQAVLDGNGIVGQVIEVGPITSIVLLINDSESIIPVKFQNSGERGFLAGDGQKLKLIDIAKTSKVKKGDVLVTSGLAQRFPKGYPVGVVNAVSKEPGEPFLSISVLPSAGLANSELFLLVWPSQKQKVLHKQLINRYQQNDVTKK